MKLIATMPMAAAAIMYQANASGLPVTFTSQAELGCTIPPNTATPTA